MDIPPDYTGIPKIYIRVKKLSTGVGTTDPRVRETDEMAMMKKDGGPGIPGRRRMVRAPGVARHPHCRETGL